jgi:germination protein M
MCLFFSACAKGGADKRGIRIYYLNKADYGIKEQEYVPEANDRDRIIEELIAKLCVQPKEMTLRAPISGFRLLSSETKGRIVTLNFSGEYYDLSAVEEVLTRTAVVNTMCSFAEVDGVYFLVEGEAFHDADGEEPGVMEPSQFIYNSYTEMRNYERVRLHLYFAGETGDRLVDAFRTVVYNSNMPLERIVLEQVILGPNGSFAYPTVNSETRVINVTTRDRCCYINLSSDFLYGQPDVTAQTAIYSIVNSLCELPSVESVQISVEGNADVTFMESISLMGSFSMNRDLVDSQAKEEE